MIQDITNNHSESRENGSPAVGRSAAPRIAMIGCGAIAEHYHLPALATIPGVTENIVLVDRSAERTQLMTNRFNIRKQTTEIDEVIADIDGAIVAVPPALHHPICMKLLSRGVPVLCEKPLAETPKEAREMVAMARDRGVALAANHTRRLLPAYVEVKRLVSEGAIGELTEIRWEEGFEFDWPAASAFHFRSGARGALMDTGIHSLDLICWWLDRTPTVTLCQTDSFGGPEAMVDARLRSGACNIQVKLSWLSRLANRYTIVGERGSISGVLDHWDRLTITTADGRTKTRRVPHAEQDYNDFGRNIAANFVEVIASRAKPLVSAASVLPALEVMDECYESATRMNMPWLEFEEAACHASV